MTKLNKETSGAVTYIVRNPIIVRGSEPFVTVVGYKDVPGGVIARGVLIEIREDAPPAIAERWLRNKCIEIYNKKRHKELVVLPPKQEKTKVEQIEERDDDVVDPDEIVSQSNPIGDDEAEEDLDEKREPHEQATQIPMA